MSLVAWASMSLGLLALLVAWSRNQGKPQGWRERAGRKGEDRVSRELDRIGLDHVDDVMFRAGRLTVQVDHLVAVGDGLVVIEVKNLAGKLVTDGDGWWSQTRPGKATRRFQDPVHQARWQAVASSRAFRVPCREVVAMVGSARFGGPWPPGVVTMDGLAGMLQGPKASRRGLAALRDARKATGPDVAPLRRQHVRRVNARHGTRTPGEAWAVAGAMALGAAWLLR